MRERKWLSLLEMDTTASLRRVRLFSVPASATATLKVLRAFCFRLLATRR